MSAGPYSLGHGVDGIKAIPIRNIILMSGMSSIRHRRPDWLKSCNLLIAQQVIAPIKAAIRKKNGIAVNNCATKRGKDISHWSI